MGLYGRYLLPRLVHLAMKHPQAHERRMSLIPQATGTVLEVGIGSGLNLRFYTNAARHIYGVEPSEQLLSMARAAARHSPVPVELICADAEHLPLQEASIDTVVMTWTLCSIAAPARALAEMKRVLRRDGKLLFVEHGLAPDPSVQRWQHRLTPHWARLAGGCHLDRSMDTLIVAAGFRIDALNARYVPGPKPFTFFYEGSASPV